MNKKLQPVIGITILLLLVGAFVYFFFIKDVNKPEPVGPEDAYVYADYIISYDASGSIYLYDLDGNKLGETNLKDLIKADSKEVLIKEVIQEEREIPEQVVEEEKEEVSFMDKFIQQAFALEGKEDLLERLNEELNANLTTRSIKIQKGDSIWRLQAKETPNIPTLKLFPHLKTINETSTLHPIHAGETYEIFTIKTEAPTEAELNPQTESKETVSSNEKTDDINAKADNEEIFEPTFEEEIIEPASVQVKEKQVNVTKEDMEFVYYKDDKTNRLFAYNVLDENIYVIVVEQDELHAQEFLRLGDFYDKEVGAVKEFKVVDNNVIMLSQSGEQLHIFLPAQGEHHVLELRGYASTFEIDEDVIYYAVDDMLVKTNIGQKDEVEIHLGDITDELFVIEDKLYAFNEFGRYTNNALLFEVDKETLAVYDFMELGSEQAVLLVDNRLQEVFAGKPNESTETVDFRFIDVETFKADNAETVLPKEAQEMYAKLFYFLHDGEVHVTPVNGQEAIVNFQANGEDLFLIVQ